MASRPRFAVIGGGVAGLSAAAILSRRADVTVYERAAAPGGKMRQIEIGGRPIDSGPTVFTMDWAFREVFALAGGDFDTAVTRRKLDVLARHYWSDGSCLDLYADPAKSAAAIAAFAGRVEADNYLAFCSRTRAVFETLREPFLRAQKPSFAGLIARQSPLALLNTAPFASLWSVLSRSFSDPRLRQLFARYATYCGASPFRAPATLMLIAHVEQAGVWALDGGMQAIARALHGLAEGNGARFRFGAHVDAIERGPDGRAAGVRLATGEVCPAEGVVANADAAALATGALGPAGQAALGAASVSAERSQSAITWSLVTQPRGVDLSMHTVFFSDDYPAEFDAVFNGGRVPADPTTYVCAQDRAPGMAPPTGPERLLCLINAPATGDTHPQTAEEIAQCQDAMVTRLKRCGLDLGPGLKTGLKSGPKSGQVTTPADFHALFPATGGALYGAASHGWRASFQRPGARTRLAGLYLAGGSVHPGPGVPMAALSGRAAAQAVMADYGLTSPSPQAVMPGGISMP
ncbi:MAG: 1-hydroxycarotenoid 3,4-desaturase CrtD [Pseudomonadota bacterium]